MSRSNSKPDRYARPKTKGDAIRLIELIYRDNNWDADEQAKHRELLGMRPADLTEYEIEELRRIVGDFADSRMVLFEE